jgi:hypothetical protein
MVSNSRPTLLLTVSLLARRRRTSSNRLASKVLVGLMVSQVARALFLATVEWVVLLLHRLAMACLLTVLLTVKASLCLPQAHSPRTTSQCQSVRPGNTDLPTCRARVKGPLEMKASRPHRSLRHPKRLSHQLCRPTQSLSRTLEPQCLRLRLPPPLLRRRSNRSPPPPQLSRLPRRPRRSILNRRPRGSRPTVALPSHSRPLPAQSLLLRDNQSHRLRPRPRPSHSPPRMPMPRTPLLPPSQPLWLNLDQLASSNSRSSSHRLQRTWTTSRKK